MLNTKVTILIPTYQRPELLARAIDSVVNQSHKDLIVRIHDNGSDVATPELMSRLISNDSRIEYYRHPKNIGQLSNFQSLIDSIKTPYYSIISDDDFLLPGHLEAAVKKLIQYPEAYFYSSATATLNLLDNKIEFRNMNWDEAFYTPSMELTYRVSSEHFTSTGTVFSAKVLNNIKYFHPLGMDDVLSVLLTGCFPFVASPSLGAVFTVNEKRGRWHHIVSVTTQQILRAGALDRKFVLDHAHLDTESYLLEYLEYIYGSLIEEKALHLYRLSMDNREEFSNQIHKSVLFKFLLRSSLAKIIKTYTPNKLLEKLIDARLAILKTNQKKSGNVLPISHFDCGLNYLKHCDLGHKNKFYDELYSIKND